MSNQPRVAKVLAALLVSMTVGAVVLMALGNNPPSAGPFCLNAYYRLEPVDKAIISKATQYPNRWNCVEIFYSGTKGGNIDQLASLNGLSGPEEINCHFIVCNGLGATDGQIQTTEKWKRQWSAIPGQNWYGTAQTIRICLVANSKNAKSTDYQIRRTEALLETLHRKFNIEPYYTYYPGNWK